MSANWSPKASCQPNLFQLALICIPTAPEAKLSVVIAFEVMPSAKSAAWSPRIFTACGEVRFVDLPSSAKGATPAANIWL